MTTRSNHGAQLQRRRDVALRNLETRLRTGNHNIYGVAEGDLQRKLSDKAREKIQAEIDVLKQRGAS